MQISSSAATVSRFGGKRTKITLISVGGALLIALLLRLWGVGYDLPYIYHPDEPTFIAISQGIFKTGDLNPHFFNYPSFLFYINALAYIPYYFLGKLLGGFQTPSSILPPFSLAMGVAKAQMPKAVLLGRIITVCFGVGSVALAFLAGRQLTGKATVGFLAALMVAISPTNVSHSRFITPNTFVVFFALAAFSASVLIYQQGKTWQYVVAGICVGLTISSKYNGALIVSSLLLAHFLRHGKKALHRPNLYLALLLCGLGFLIATPFALIDSPKFLTDLRTVAQHYSTGHEGMEGNAVKWYLERMWQTGSIIYILATLELLRGARSRSKGIALLSVFPLMYFAFISRFAIRNDVTFLPLTPFAFILAASLLAHLFDKANALPSKASRKLSIIVLASRTTVALMQPTARTIADTIQLTRVNSRETARIWIADNLPSGAKIAMESYSPFVEPAQFSVQSFRRVIDHEPEWYTTNGFEYLIFGQGMYGRFYREPERYGAEIAQYDDFFGRFTPTRIFTDGDYEVRIYKVK